MAGKTEMMNVLMLKMENVDRQVTSLREELLTVMPFIKQLQPHVYLRAVRKPIQGSDYKRVVNVAEFMRSEIEVINNELIPGQRRLFQFPSSMKNEQLNADAMRCISLLLARELDTNFGKMTYDKLFFEKPTTFAKVVEEASLMAELAIFSQSAGKWSLEIFVKYSLNNQIGKVKRREESARKKDETVSGSRTFNVVDVPAEKIAPAVVPDLPAQVDIRSGQPHDCDIAGMNEEMHILPSPAVNRNALCRRSSSVANRATPRTVGLSLSVSAIQRNLSNNQSTDVAPSDTVRSRKRARQNGTRKTGPRQSRY